MYLCMVITFVKESTYFCLLYIHTMIQLLISWQFSSYYALVTCHLFVNFALDMYLTPQEKTNSPSE